MKLKIFLSTLIFVIVGGITVSQLSLPVSAVHNNPITSPVTSAMVKLSGIIYYLKNYHFVPSPGATVTATNKKTHEEVTAIADSNGLYELMVPKGNYKLEANGSSDSANYKFLPKLSLPLLIDMNLNFYGLPKH